MSKMTPTQEKHTLAWIEALLSGRYKQGLCALRQQDGPNEPSYYCVNGVLAEVAGFPWDADKQAYRFGRYADPRDIISVKLYGDAFLPNQWFKEFTGLPFPPVRLQAMNDAEASFVQLAAYLISYLPDGSEKARLQHLAAQKAGWVSATEFDADLTRHSDEEAKGDAV